MKENITHHTSLSSCFQDLENVPYLSAVINEGPSCSRRATIRLRVLSVQGFRQSSVPQFLFTLWFKRLA